MFKKIVNNFVFILILIAVLVLVYVFITKGYQGIGGSPAAVSETATNSPSLNESPTPVQTSSTTTSNKITLSVTSPIDGATLNSTNVIVKGKTSPNAEVFVNDQSTKADANGNFSISIGLDEGANQIVVSANDSVGNATEQDLNVTVSSFQ